MFNKFTILVQHVRMLAFAYWQKKERKKYSEIKSTVVADGNVISFAGTQRPMEASLTTGDIAPR